MKTSAALLLAGCLVLAGCVEKREPAGSAGQGESKTEPAKTAPAEPQNAVEKYAKTLSTAPAKAAATIDIASIQRAIQQFGAMEGRNPKSLEELVAMRYLPAIPPVPHGKRLSYDPQSGSITLVDE